MVKVLEDITGSVILTKGEYGFQHIIDGFNTAKYINIITYNITPFENSGLLNVLKGIPIDTPVNIVLNIPKKSYRSDDASKQIYYYLKTLEREKFNDLNVYFNFSNHAKLIMTNNKAYIGSQNFSDASSNNLELGVLVHDNNDVEKIRDEIFEIIKSDSIRYATSDYIIVMEEISIYMQDVFDELRYNLFTFVGDPPYTPEYEVFTIENANFPKKEWARFKELDENLFEIFNKIGDEYDYIFNNNKAENLKDDINRHLTLFISELDLFSEYLDTYDSRTMDLFYKIDDGNTDATMDIVMQKVHEEMEVKFGHLDQKGKELLINFEQIKMKIELIVELIEEIKYEMIKNTVYENLNLVK